MFYNMMGVRENYGLSGTLRSIFNW